jgi:N-acetylglutamate synthase-like GNAT family acetyltransferase
MTHPSSPPVFLRKFMPEDAEKLSRMIIRNLRQFNIREYSNDVIEALVTYFTTNKLIERAKSKLLLVCAIEEDLIGTATLDADRVRYVFVDMDRHKTGVGRILMDAIESHAQQHGISRIYLSSGLSAIGFYEKLGYREIERYSSDLNGIPFPLVKMDKVLKTI